MSRHMLIGVAGVAAAWSAPAVAPIAPWAAAALGVPRRIPSLGAVALTFDDGPHPEGTPAALEALAATGARATFFLVGEQVERHPTLVAEIASAGHSLAIHAHRHRNQLRLTPAQVSDDLDRAASVIGDVAGFLPALYRPPYGIFSWPGLRSVRRRGWKPLLWSRWGRDWSASATADSIAAKVTEHLVAGDVLLLHDADTYSAEGSHRRTVAALPRVLEEIALKGLEPVAL